MKKMIVLGGLLLVMGACSDSEQSSTNENSVEDGNLTNENNAVDHGIEDEESVGFTLNENGQAIEADVPEEEAAAILGAYEEYIEAFNEEDIDRYMEVIAREPDGFDREEDRAALMDAFETYDTVYETSDETIVEYEEGRAEVFAEIEMTIKETGTSKNTTQSGRHVVVFKTEDSDWKVTSLYAIGNQ
ncbi:DUF4440 domain-containing protein [Planococcus salinus]|uniref:Nuclear transport factor 2 family protein n=1 Tax=Planococcus salinus TaxID=1848460 RepID=A0A3M8P3A2_9BACL|nr:nuclear transport factor 2 family protein [Planococcus salinus]RNF38195.1 nuclear transport factor 2 family protein [Planococcus salinus]